MFQRVFIQIAIEWHNFSYYVSSLEPESEEGSANWL